MTQQKIYKDSVIEVSMISETKNPDLKKNYIEIFKTRELFRQGRK